MSLSWLHFPNRRTEFLNHNLTFNEQRANLKREEFIKGGYPRWWRPDLFAIRIWLKGLELAIEHHDFHHLRYPQSVRTFHGRLPVEGLLNIYASLHGSELNTSQGVVDRLNAIIASGQHRSNSYRPAAIQRGVRQKRFVQYLRRYVLEGRTMRIYKIYGTWRLQRPVGQ
jgi:hypothetical protein